MFLNYYTMKLFPLLLAGAWALSHKHHLHHDTHAVAKRHSGADLAVNVARDLMPTITTELSSSTSSEASSSSESDSSESESSESDSSESDSSNSDSSSEASTTESDSTTEASATSDSLSLFTSASSLALSTGLPVFTTSSSLAEALASYHVVVPVGTNPYILNLLKPTNLVFIIVFAVLVAMFMTFVAAWVILWLKSRRRAQQEKAVHYYNPVPRYTGLGGLFGQNNSYSDLALSFCEKLLAMSSGPSLGTTPGRQYREMAGAAGYQLRRNSIMTISPVMEMMRGSLALLPLHHDTPMRTEPATRPAGERRSRPPSQMLDDMLLAIEYLQNYP